MEPALFSQGAALKAMDLTQDKTSYPYVMLCEGRLDTTISVKVLHQDKENQLILRLQGTVGMRQRVQWILFWIIRIIWNL